MSDRIKGVTVILDKNYRYDDVEAITDAIRMIKGVVRVEPIIEGSSSFVAEMSTKTNIRSKLLEFIKENL